MFGIMSGADALQVTLAKIDRVSALELFGAREVFQYATRYALLKNKARKGGKKCVVL